MDFVRPVEAVIPGAPGRILAVLVETSAELNVRTVARLSGVSSAQASRLLPNLVELGMVERREVPPSALFRFVPEHVAARLVVALRDARGTVVEELAGAAQRLRPPPVSVVLFGSFARREAGRDSDLDVLVVRPASLPEDDPAWRSGVDGWRAVARRLTGNRVDVLEVPEAEVGRRLRSRHPLWGDIRSDGVVLQGRTLAQLQGRESA